MDFLLTTVVDALNPVAWDLTLDATGNLLFVTDELEELRQRLTHRLRSFRGEWFLDTRLGVPYFEDILVKNPRRELVTSILREVILKTDGVASIKTFTLDIDNATRAATVRADVVASNGRVLSFSSVLVGSP